MNIRLIWVVVKYVSNVKFPSYMNDNEGGGNKKVHLFDEYLSFPTNILYLSIPVPPRDDQFLLPFPFSLLLKITPDQLASAFIFFYLRPTHTHTKSPIKFVRMCASGSVILHTRIYTTCSFVASLYEYSWLDYWINKNGKTIC